MLSAQLLGDLVTKQIFITNVRHHALIFDLHRWLDHARSERERHMKAGGAARVGGMSDQPTLFERIIASYDRGLGVVLKYQGLTLVIAVATLALTVALYVFIPKGLFPTQDTGELQAEIHVARTVSYTRMAEVQQEVAKAILADPDVRSLSSFISVDGSNTTLLGVGRMLINLKEARTTRQPETMARLKERG